MVSKPLNRSNLQLEHKETSKTPHPVVKTLNEVLDNHLVTCFDKLGFICRFVEFYTYDRFLAYICFLIVLIFFIGRFVMST